MARKSAWFSGSLVSEILTPEKIKQNIVMTYCRVKEMRELCPERRAWMIKHHVRQAVETYERAMNSGVVIYVPSDNMRKVADMISRQPNLLRGRLDAVFAGLSIVGKRKNQLESDFEDIEAHWTERIDEIYLYTNRRYAERVALCKDLAYVFRPRYEDYFCKLVREVNNI